MAATVSEQHVPTGREGASRLWGAVGLWGWLRRCSVVQECGGHGLTQTGPTAKTQIPPAPTKTSTPFLDAAASVGSDEAGQLFSLLSFSVEEDGQQRRGRCLERGGGAAGQTSQQAREPHLNPLGM